MTMNNSLQVYNAQERMAYWTDAVSRCRSSGLSVRSWCNQEGIREKTYYYWQKKIYQSACRQTEFVEMPGSCAATQSVVAEVLVNGMTAIVHSGADAATLQNLIAAMKQC